MRPPVRLAMFVLTVVLAWAALALMPARAAEPLKPGDHFRDCKYCPELVVVPAGRYVMGDNRSRFAAERPAHLVTLAKPFAVGVYEVTFDEWDACRKAKACEKNPSDHKWGRGKRPVMNVSWPEAQRYARWLTVVTGHKYRLPSEAEWEYVARAGTYTQYWWGDDPGKDNADCRTCLPEIPHQTYEVGSFRANPFGLYDVAGNVWEWTLDCWNPDQKGAHNDGTARKTGDCRYRVVRGGSWYYVNTNVRSAYRSKFAETAYSYGIGFRVLRELP